METFYKTYHLNIENKKQLTEMALQVCFEYEVSVLAENSFTRQKIDFLPSFVLEKLTAKSFFVAVDRGTHLEIGCSTETSTNYFLVVKVSPEKSGSLLDILSNRTTLLLS